MLSETVLARDNVFKSALGFIFCADYSLEEPLFISYLYGSLVLNELYDWFRLYELVYKGLPCESVEDYRLLALLLRLNF